MAITPHEKIHPLPGGIYTDSNAAQLAQNNMGQLPDFSTLGPSLGKMPAAGSFIGFCFVPSINKSMPGYAAFGIKNPASGQLAKVRVLLTDHPDGG